MSLTIAIITLTIIITITTNATTPTTTTTTTTTTTANTTFSRFLPEEPVGGYTEVQKAWQAWTFVDFGQKSSVQDGRAGGEVAATDCACVGFGAIRAGGFLPVEAAGS